MMKTVLGILILLVLQGCNVAEQKVVSETGTNQNSSNDEKFDLSDGNIFIGFRREGDLIDEDISLAPRVKLFRVGDDSQPLTITIQVMEDISSADQNDIASIEDEDGNTLALSSTSNPTFNIVMPAFQRQFDFVVNMNNDSVYEGSETLTFKIVESVSGDFFIRDYPTHQLIIQDDEEPPITYVVNNVNATTSAISEGSTVDIVFATSPSVHKEEIIYNITYSGSANLDDFTSDFDISNPTVSTPGSPLPTRVILPAETFSKTVQFTAKSDTYAEENEDLIITIQNVSVNPFDQLDLTASDTITFSPRQSHQINVTETSGLSNDVSITTTCASIDEDDVASACTLTVTLDDEIDEDSYVDLDFSGTASLAADYTVSTTRLEFLKDQGSNQSKSFTITPIDDNFRDSAETIIVTLSPDSRLGSGTPSSSTITINDNEAAVTIGFSLSAYQVTEGATLTIPVSVNNPSNETITVNYSLSTAPADSATPNVDHNLSTSGTFSVNAGDLSSNTTFLTFNDTPFDDEEVIYLTLTGVASGSATLSGSTTLEITIREASELPILEFSESTQTVIEGNTLTVNLSTDKVSESAQPYVISLSEVTTSSGDYTITSAMLNRTFPAGVTTDSFTISVASDSILEPTENFILTLASATDKAFGTITSQNISVVDNTTPPTLDISASAATIAEGSSGSINMTYASSAVSGFDVPITYTITGTSTSGDDHTLASGSVTLPKNQNSVSVSFDIYDDNIYEGVETIIATIGSDPTKYTLGTSTTTISITDAQAIPEVSFGGIAGSGFDSYFDNFEGDSINIPIALDHASASDIDITLTVEDKWGTTDDCGSKCASIFNYDSIHKNLAQVTNTSMNNVASAGQVGTSSSYRIEFSAVPTSGQIDINYNDDTGALVGSEAILFSDITAGSIDTVCDNLVSEINNHPNGYVRYELYAFHKNGTDYVDIKPRPRILDTDLDSQISGNQITLTIPALSTQSVLSFNLVDDDLYELGVDERFRMNITATTGGTTINASKDEAVVNIKDVHSLPRAQFVQKNYARIEPQSDTTAVISIPIFLSNLSESEVDYKIVIENDPSASLGYADENDFIILDTVSKTNPEASSVYNRVRGTISATSGGTTIPKFPRFIYNETEVGQNIIQDGYSATISSIERQDTVVTPANSLVNITFQGTGNTGTFDLLGTDASTNTISITSLCNGCTGTATASALATHINTTYSGELIASSSGAVLSIQPAYMPALQYTSNIVKEFRIKVPAGQDVDYIPILIENDEYYEGTESLTIKLEQISSATAPVNTALDSSGLINNEAFLQINDDESLSQVTITSNTTSEAEGTASSRANIATGTYSYNDVTYTVNISPLFQVEDIQFDIDISGDMTYEPSISSPSDFMQGDYRFDLSTSAGMDAAYGAFDDNGKITMTYPAGYSNGSVQFDIRVHEDYRYESDETLTVTLNNNSAADIGGSNSNSIVFTDDDSSYVFLGLQGQPTFPNDIPEYQSQIDTFEFYAVDDFTPPNFTGADITEVTATFDYSINASYRHNTSDPDLVASGSITLSSSVNFERDLIVDQFGLGDFRAFDTVTLVVNNLSNIDYLSSYGTSSYNLVTNFTVPDLKVKTAVEGTWSSSPQEFRSHSCSLFRGQVSCFGDNRYGQLGKGIADTNWGGGSSENETSQDEVIDLGTNPDTGRPAYALDLALGKYHTCALLSTNDVVCWGRNDFGQLGRGDTVDTVGQDSASMGNSLVYVDLGTDDEIESIHASENSSCAFFKDAGLVKCWGSNEAGILGIESTVTAVGTAQSEMGTNLAYMVEPNINLFEMGPEHACARNTSNEFGCWGRGQFGQLGNNSGTATVGTTAGSVTGEFNVKFSGISNINDIAIGRRHTCVNFNSSTFSTRCFGINFYGQLGLGRVSTGAATDVDVNLYNTSTISNTTTARSNRTNYIGRVNVDATENKRLETGGSNQSFPGTNSLYIPGNSSSTGLINLGVTNNQFVQIRQPASQISAGLTYGCGVYDTYSLNNSTQSNRKHIRCWGSNKVEGGNIFSLEDFPNSGTTDNIDLGLLNNTGWSRYFDGRFYDNTTLPPFRNTVNGAAVVRTSAVLPASTSLDCQSSPGSSLCTFAKRMAMIGKDSHAFSSHFAVYNYYFDPDNVAPFSLFYQYGWLTNFEGTGQRLNFELNHGYSIVKKNLESYDEIQMDSGSYGTCIAPQVNSPTNLAQANNEFMCWGANHVGQTGDTINNFSFCNTKIIGGFLTCSAQRRGVIRSLDYSY